MSTDRELLEKAAKAAGYEFGYVNDKLVVMIPGSCGTFGCTRPHSTSWDPLNDDGDVLRLAVKLDLLNSPRVTYEIAVDRLTNKADKLVATRRAIVRAAAAIGEKMP